MSTPGNRQVAKHVLSALLLSLAAVSAHADSTDPWEGFNRKIFSFNEKADRYVLKPVAKGYQYITPRPVEEAVTRFFNNLGEPMTFVNELLQGKPREASMTLARFMFNSTGGVVGLFDIAAPMGLPLMREDFGQTLAVWGLRSGPYVMLPLLGPSTVRDFGGRVVDRTTSDPRYYMNTDLNYGLTGVDAINTRAGLLDVEKTIQGDRYNFIRDYYLQSRAFAIADGVVTKDEFLDDSAADSSSGTGGSAGTLVK